LESSASHSSLQYNLLQSASPATLHCLYCHAAPTTLLLRSIIRVRFRLPLLFHLLGFPLYFPPEILLLAQKGRLKILLFGLCSVSPLQFTNLVHCFPLLQVLDRLLSSPLVSLCPSRSTFFTRSSFARVVPYKKGEQNAKIKRGKSFCYCLP
jgi:hypothetical protein